MVQVRGKSQQRAFLVSTQLCFDLILGFTGTLSSRNSPMAHTHSAHYQSHRYGSAPEHVRPDIMDQRIFAQLDQLQRGARETQPRSQEYGRHQTTHTGYDEYDEYDQAPTHYGEEDVYGDENMIPLDVDGMED